MIQHHHWSLAELEDMLPYEKQIYQELLAQWVKEENERIEEMNKKIIDLEKEIDAFVEENDMEELQLKRNKYRRIKRSNRRWKDSR